MLSIEYKNLIDKLVALTASDKIGWQKFDSKNSLFCITNDGVRIVLDKYFSKNTGKEAAMCINLTIFKNDNDILDELVYCDNDNVDVKADFNTLEQLYNVAETKYLDKNINSELRKISESLSHG